MLRTGPPVALVAMLVGLSVPVQPAPPYLCGLSFDPCEIFVDVSSFKPPAFVIDSGDWVVWTSLDFEHFVVEGNDATGDGDRCFLQPVPEGGSTRLVRFFLQEGTLFATETIVYADGSEEMRTAACETAVSLGAGRRALTFQCEIHPWLLGTLIVLPP